MTIVCCNRDYIPEIDGSQKADLEPTCQKRGYSNLEELHLMRTLSGLSIKRRTKDTKLPRKSVLRKGRTSNKKSTRIAEYSIARGEVR